MADVRFTEKELYTMIKSLCDEEFEIEVDGKVGTQAEIIDFCDKKLAQIESKAEKSKEKRAEKKAEGEALTNAIKQLIEENPKTADEVFEALEASDFDTEEVTIYKVRARLIQLVKEGFAADEYVKRDKKQKKGYKLA